MPQYAEEPLTKITLNLFKKDVSLLKEIFPTDYTTEIRNIIRKWLRARTEEADYE